MKTPELTSSSDLRITMRTPWRQEYGWRAQTGAHCLHRPWPTNILVSVKGPPLPFQQCVVAIKACPVTNVDPLSLLAPGDVKCAWKGAG